MDDPHIIALFQRDPPAGYAALLDRHTATVLRMTRRFFRQKDDQMEAYTLVVERLHANEFAALKRFTEGTSLLPWLSVITANASRDVLRARRSASEPKSVTRQLSEFERAVFMAYFRQQYQPNEIVEVLRTGGYPDCTSGEVSDALDRANELLSPAKRWSLLAVHLINEANPSYEQMQEGGFQAEGVLTRPADEALVQSERVGALNEAIRTLGDADQLMLRLWFEQGMKGAEVARLIGLDDGSSIYTRIRSVLRQLKRVLAQSGITE